MDGYEGPGGRLRAALVAERRRRRVSQADAASRVGRSRKWLSDYERGLTDPAAGTLLELAEALGVEVAIVSRPSPSDGLAGCPPPAQVAFGDAARDWTCGCCGEDHEDRTRPA